MLQERFFRNREHLADGVVHAFRFCLARYVRGGLWSHPATIIAPNLGDHGQANAVPVPARHQYFEDLFRRQPDFAGYRFGIQGFGINLVFAQFVANAESIQQPDALVFMLFRLA